MLKKRFPEIEGLDFSDEMKDALTNYARLRQFSFGVRAKIQSLIEYIPLIKPLPLEKSRYDDLTESDDD